MLAIIKDTLFINSSFLVNFRAKNMDILNCWQYRLFINCFRRIVILEIIWTRNE